MKKSLFLTIITMIFLYFLWWFSGGTIMGLQKQPAPIEYATAFIWNNFQTGAAIVFQALASLLSQ